MNPKKMFNTNINIRGYELDSFGHLNNAVYINYLEQARWEILNLSGYLKSFRSSGLLLVVVDTHIRYMKELQLFDNIEIQTKIVVESPFIIFKHHIINKENNNKHARATIKTILIDQNRLPIDIPEEFILFLTK